MTLHFWHFGFLFNDMKYYHFLNSMKTRNVFYKSRWILDKNGNAPFEKISTHCTPPLICDDWPKNITPCTSSTRLDFFFRFSIWQYDKKNSSDSSSMIWASSQSFCTKLIFAKNCSHLWHLWMSDSACRHQQLLWYCISFVNNFFSSFSSTCFCFTYRSDRWLHEELWQLNEGNYKR